MSPLQNHSLAVPAITQGLLIDALWCYMSADPFQVGGRRTVVFANFLGFGEGGDREFLGSCSSMCFATSG